MFWGEGWCSRSGGNRHRGHGRQGPPGTPAPPSEETHGLNCLKQTSVQSTHQPSSLTPRWWQQNLSPSSSVRRRDLNPLICHQCVSTEGVVIQQTLGTIKKRSLFQSQQLYSPYIFSVNKTMTVNTGVNILSRRCVFVRSPPDLWDSVLLRSRKQEPRLWEGSLMMEHTGRPIKCMWHTFRHHKCMIVTVNTDAY